MGSALTDSARSDKMHAAREGGRDGAHYPKECSGRAGGPLTEGTKGKKSEIGSVGAEKKRRGARAILPVSPSEEFTLIRFVYD